MHGNTYNLKKYMHVLYYLVATIFVNIVYIICSCFNLKVFVLFFILMEICLKDFVFIFMVQKNQKYLLFIYFYSMTIKL